MLYSDIKRSITTCVVLRPQAADDSDYLVPQGPDGGADGADGADSAGAEDDGGELGDYAVETVVVKPDVLCGTTPD